MQNFLLEGEGSVNLSLKQQMPPGMIPEKHGP